MEFLAGLVELLYIVNLAGLVLALPVWLLLGVLILIGSRRAAAGSGPGADMQAGVTRLGRPVQRASLYAVGLMFAAGLTVYMAYAASSADERWLPLFWVGFALLAAGDVACIAVWALLIAIWRDTFTERLTAGRSTATALAIMTTATTMALAGGAWVGIYSNLTP